MFKGWTKFEKLLLILGVLLVGVVGILFKSDLMATVCSVVGIVSALLLAKGKNLGQIFGLLVVMLYSLTSFRNGFYGEVIIYVFLMLPMYVIGIKKWAKHQNKKTDSVEINEIGFKEWIVVLILSIFVFVGMYYLLRLFNTNELIISTISVITSLSAVYLQMRRSGFSFGFYMINDLVMFGLWIVPVINGNLFVLPMVFNPVVNLINDGYGLYNWKRMKERQRKEK